MTKEFEQYHGIVFTKLVHNDLGTAVSIRTYPTGGNASYILNENVGIYIKHSAKRMSPWRFSFLKKHQDEIATMKIHLREVFLVLVCGKDGVVSLCYSDLKKILNEVHDDIEWISAARNPKKEYTIKGSDGVLERKIGKSNFPKKIIETLSH